MPENKFLNDLSHITKQTDTLLLDILHASKIQDLPKIVFYGTRKLSQEFNLRISTIKATYSNKRYIV